MHAQFCSLWPARLYYIFPHYPIQGTIFEKKIVIEHTTRVSSFSTTLSAIYLILRGNERDMIKNVYWAFQICLVSLIKIL